MNVAQLRSIVGSVKPAVSAKAMLPLYQAVAFDGKTCRAHSDLLAIKVRCKLDLRAAVPGVTLAEWLAKCPGDKEVVVEDTEDEIKLKVGRSRVSLPVIARPDDYIPMPNTKKMRSFAADGFASALGAVSATLGVDPAHEWRLGATLLFDGDELHAYSCDGLAATCAVVQGVDAEDDLDGFACGVSPSLVATIAARADKLKRVYVSEDATVATFTDGSRASGRNSDAQVGEEAWYVDMFATDYDTYPIPKPMRGALDRSQIVQTANAGDRLSVRIQSGKMTLSAQSELGLLTDRLSFKQHPDASALVETKLLARSSSDMSHIGFHPVGERAVVALSGERRGVEVRRVCALSQNDSDEE